MRSVVVNLHTDMSEWLSDYAIKGARSIIDNVNELIAHMGELP